MGSRPDDRIATARVLSDARAFVWSGWLMLMELDGSDNPVRKYTWGLDLAGQSGSVNSLEAAGGIGGLLAMQDPDDDGDPNDPNDFELNYVYAYDGNANVGQLVAWEPGYGGAWGYMWDTAPPTNARLAARYEYAPYGNLIGPDTDADGDFDGDDDPGPYAGENPFRFSTKYWDDETGLGCWPLRYYDPAMGRWVSRDPIEEVGGWNLYGYCLSDPIDLYDLLGDCVDGDEDRSTCQERSSSEAAPQERAHAELDPADTWDKTVGRVGQVVKRAPLPGPVKKTITATLKGGRVIIKAGVRVSECQAAKLALLEFANSNPTGCRRGVNMVLNGRTCAVECQCNCGTVTGVHVYCLGVAGSSETSRSVCPGGGASHCPRYCQWRTHYPGSTCD